MSRKEERNLLLMEIIKNGGKTPKVINISGKECAYNGEQKLGNCTIFRYRPVGQLNYEGMKSEIMIAVETDVLMEIRDRLYV